MLVVLAGHGAFQEENAQVTVEVGVNAHMTCRFAA
jgi:hypothetical protein